MAGTTPFLGLYLPGGGSTGTWTPDEVADIDPLNQNFIDIDEGIAAWGLPSARNQQYYGAAASLGGIVGMKRGDTYQESDGSFILWKYDGSNWITNEGGMYLVRPTGVVNGTIQPNGHVTASGAADTISITGCFTQRFNRYKVFANWVVTGGVNGAFLRLTTAGLPVVSASYVVQALAVSGVSVTGSAAATSTPGGVPVAGDEHATEYTYCDPADPAKMTKVAGICSARSGTTGIGMGEISIFNNILAAHDGIQFVLSTSGAGRFFTSTDISVYGIV